VDDFLAIGNDQATPDLHRRMVQDRFMPVCHNAICKWVSTIGDAEPGIVPVAPSRLERSKLRGWRIDRLAPIGTPGRAVEARRAMMKSWIAAFMGLVAFYYVIPQLSITDSRYVIATADSLLRTGSLDLRPLVRADKDLPLPVNNLLLVAAIDLAPATVAEAKAAGVGPLGKGGAVDYYMTYDLINNGPDGAAAISLATLPPVLPLFPTWPSFAAMPISLATAALGVSVFDGTTFREDRNELYQKIVAAVLVAAAVAFFYAAARCLLASPYALGLSAWFACGPLVSSTSRALWSDTFALPLSFAGLYIFTRVILVGRPMRHWPVMLAAVLSFAFMMKPVYAIPSAMLGILVLGAPSLPLRLKVSFVAVCALLAAFFVATSLLIYGNMLPPYFAPSRGSSFEFPRLAAVLFSPGRGALWFTPSLLVTCCTPLLVRQDRRLFVTTIVAVAAVTAAVLAVSDFDKWWGGWSFGPRLLQFALPATALLALVFVRAASLRSGREQIAILVLCIAIAEWEGIVHVSGVMSGRGWEWNTTPINVDLAPQRLWDWSDPQFLAAFRKAAPV
jgi:hypothetical protein